MAKYEVWGRREIGKGKRERLAFGLSNEVDAQKVRSKYRAEGLADCIIVQRPPRYGSIKGLQKTGRRSESA